MKKLLLMIVLGLLISSYSNSQPNNPCVTGCTYIDDFFRGVDSCHGQGLGDFNFPVGTCELSPIFMVYSCPGPPPEIRLVINTIYPVKLPSCPSCCQLTLNQILPSFYDYVIKQSVWIKHHYLDLLPFGGCITNISLATPVCWLHDTTECGWARCDTVSCCIKHFQICKSLCGVITTTPLDSISVIPCDINAPPYCNYIYCQ